MAKGKSSRSSKSKSTSSKKPSKRRTSSRRSEPKGSATDSVLTWARRNDKLLIGFGVLIAIILISVIWATFEKGNQNGETTMRWSSPPAMQIDPTKQYFATMKTEKGDIRIELFADKVPNTVNNFVFLARQHYYDNSTFHRVIPGFMAQGGDPTGTGRGGPGYSFADEFDPSLRHDAAGILSMANAGANTNGSQFFITYAPQPHLDGKHAVFGKVVSGMDVLNSLTPRDPTKNPAFTGDRILTIEIEEQ